MSQGWINPPFTIATRRNLLKQELATSALRTSQRRLGYTEAQSALRELEDFQRLNPLTVTAQILSNPEVRTLKGRFL